MKLKYLAVLSIASMLSLSGATLLFQPIVQAGPARTTSVDPCASKNPCASHPCAGANPCAGKNPCASHPCAGANPCAGKKPCAGHH